MVHTVDDRDPFRGRQLLSRGIAGSRGDVSIGVHDHRVRRGVVGVRLRSGPA